MFLTESGVYKCIFKSRKKFALEFQDFVCSILKEIRLKGRYDLQEQMNLKELENLEKIKKIEDEKKLIELENLEKIKKIEDESKLKEEKIKLIELELQKIQDLSYEPVEKNETVYIFSTDVDGVYKVGLTKNTASKRKSGLQTGSVDEIKVLFEYKTHNCKILESVVHYLLDRYRCNSNREHFRCKIEYMKKIISIVGKTVDTLKSAFHNITESELIEILNEVMEEDIDKFTKKYKNEMNVYEQFIIDCCIVDKTCSKQHFIERSSLWEAFKNWKRNSDFTNQNIKQSDFNKEISKRFGKNDVEKDRYMINNIRYFGYYDLQLI
jgi:hypothetical protein